MNGIAAAAEVDVQCAHGFTRGARGLSRAAALGKLAEPLLEAVRERAQALAARVDHDLRYFPVERVPLVVEPDQSRHRILRPEERAVTVVARALPQVMRRCAQVDDNPVGLQERPVLGGEYGAAAGGEHDVGAMARVLRSIRRSRARNPCFTLDLENDGNAHARGALDLMVAIVKRLAEAAREQLPTEVLPAPISPTRKILPRRCRLACAVSLTMRRFYRNRPAAAVAAGASVASATGCC